MQRRLWESAQRFAATLPRASLDGSALGRTLSRVAREPGPRQQLAALGFGLLSDQSVARHGLAFLNDQLATAAIELDCTEPEADAALLLSTLLDEQPAWGLEVAVACARGSAKIDELQRHDSIIMHLHKALKDTGAIPVGPQEHCADKEHAPGNQWVGHMQSACAPHVEHDVLVVLAGRSVGVGDCVAIARQLRIPVIVGIPRWVNNPSCRLSADGDLIQAPIRGATDEQLVERIAAAVASTGRNARAEQRRRIRAIQAIHDYRMYLAALPGVSTLPPPFQASVNDPFRLLALAPVSRDALVESLGAFSEPDFRTYTDLQPSVRAAFDDAARQLLGPAQGELLRSGSRNMLLQAMDSRPQRRLNWSDPQTWRRCAVSR